MPSQRISSGSSAIFGTGKVAAMIGLPIASSTPKTPTARPTATPASAPRPKPSAIRSRLVTTCVVSSPERSISRPLAQHRQR